MTDSILLEIPIKEHPGGDDPLVIDVTVEAVVVSIELAQFGLTEDWGSEREAVRKEKGREGRRVRELGREGEGEGGKKGRHERKPYTY